MRIQRLEIINFKAIRQLVLEDLSDVVLLAGANGCGKSCVFDAIRLIHSVSAGPTQQLQLNAYFQEHQIPRTDFEELKRFYYDIKKDINIRAEFVFPNETKDYVVKHGLEMFTKILWSMEDVRAKQGQLIYESIDKKNARIAADASKNFQTIQNELSKPVHEVSLTFDKQGRLRSESSALVQFVICAKDPLNLGMIDFHSANRSYARERVGGININIEQTASRVTEHALYNSQNKYNNVKSEIAAAYVREIFIKNATGAEIAAPSIIKTLEELFTQFIPGKSFGGPRPGAQGQLSFPVLLDSGGEHDIDDLSSGEKELVYGYLRIRNVAPQHSVIMLDEPELHLNPRLIAGLPEFYRTRLGSDLDNQIWMATHSDAFLREAFRSGKFRIYHISAASAVDSTANQADLISCTDQVNRLVVDLVGDLAGFRPGSAMIVFESTEAASFDATMTARLFPEVSQRVNLISGDNKLGVSRLYAALDKVANQLALRNKVFAITDRDSGPRAGKKLATVFTWDAYHIENYLLEPHFVRIVLQDNPSLCDQLSLAEIEAGLLVCARETLPNLVAHELRALINNMLVQNLDLQFDPNSSAPASDLSAALGRSQQKLTESFAKISQGNLEEMWNTKIATLETSLGNDEWRRSFKGRDILKRFCGKHTKGLQYESFRDQIISRMVNAEYRPVGMGKVFGEIMKVL